MKDQVLEILEEYLKIFPEEKERQNTFLEFLKNHDSKEIIDWNNFDGHIVASGFVYAKKEQLFLILYHKDMKCFLYPGGHINSEDSNILEAARRETEEETGISNLESVKISSNELVPIDIDSHMIPYNERLDLKEHKHFDFRYLFIIDGISKVHIDTDELSEYQWVNMEKLKKNIGNQIVLDKINHIIKRKLQ